MSDNENLAMGLMDIVGELQRIGQTLQGLLDILTHDHESRFHEPEDEGSSVLNPIPGQTSIDDLEAPFGDDPR